MCLSLTHFGLQIRRAQTQKKSGKMLSHRRRKYQSWYESDFDTEY